MQKWSSLLWYWMLAAIMGAACFCFAVMKVHAGEVTGTEAFFTHVHTAACYQTSTGSCMGQHTRQQGSEYRNYHCAGCGAQTSHYVTADTCRCPVKGSTWQENGRAVCTVCGTVHSAWNAQQSASEHTITEQRLCCGISEGEKTLGIWITADNNWTNSGVSLYVRSNAIRQDAANGNVTYDWGGGSLYVTENGTYSVNAANGAGKSVTASIDICCIDKSAPSITDVSGDTGGMTKNRITVTVQAKDEESGLAESAYSFDGGGTWGSSPVCNVEEGAAVQLVVRDRAGNTTGRTLTRGDFPYPPEPAPTPAPAPSGTSSGADTNAPAVSQENGKDTGDKNASGGTEVKTQEEVQKTETEKKAKTEKTAKTEKVPQTGKKADMETKAETEFHQRRQTERNAMTGMESSKNESGKLQTGRDGKETENQSVEEQQARQVIVKRQEKTAGDGNTVKEKADLGQEPVSTDLYAGEAVPQKSGAIADFLSQNTGMLAGILLFLGTGTLLVYLLWLHSAVLYCYDGGDAYQKLGLLRLKKEKGAFSLYLPDYLAEAAKSPRYRLLVKNRLVKRRNGMDLIVYNEEHKLRQPLEECVDFVL